ncbi:MAG: leucine-rich repeat protein [Clostridiales bacterium]|nr:leucine-rich repeat protein [Clostridiales bacterium]
MKINKIKISISFLIIISIIMIGVILSSCGKTKTVYFNDSTIYLYLDLNTTVNPTVTTRPENKEYVIRSANSSIVSVAEDGKSITGLREGSVTLTVESEGITSYGKVLVFPSSSSPLIPSRQDSKYTVYFVSEAGGFPAQKVNPGEFSSDPSSQYQRPGYTLFGWYEDPEYTTLFDFANTPIYKTTVLFALWGIDVPEFNFISIEGNIFVDGLKYGFIPYETITLPETDSAERPVYGINEYAFSENANVKSLIIPEGYKEIKKYAFSGCTKLETVEIAGELEYIREYAFYESDKLKSISVSGSSLIQIDTSAFEYCSSLSSVTLPDSLLQIGPNAFKSCSSLTTFDTPDNLLKIYNSAFMLSGLSAIDLKSVEDIGTQAFWGCIYLETVTGGSSLKNIGSYPFGSYLINYQAYATKWLKDSVTNNPEVQEDKLLYIENALIYAYPGMIKPEYSVKPNISSIAGECFSDSPGAIITFQGLTPPSYIGSYVFGGGSSDNTCKSHIVVPSGKIEDYINAFLVITEVPAGLLPTAYSLSTVQNFYEKWICLDPALQIYTRNIIEWVDSETGEWDFSASEPLHILVGGYDERIDPTLPIAIDVKAETDAAANYGYYVVDTIKAYAFNIDSVIRNIYLPLYITSIETNAFAGLTNLESIRFRGDIVWDAANTTIYQYSFNTSQMPTSFKIYVPNDKLNSYKINWNYSNISSRLYGE